MPENLKVCEYIWIDGNAPTKQLRSKSRVIFLSDNPNIDSFPCWNFDGSSTLQATGVDSDCILKPINFTNDPLCQQDGYLVLCEVLNADGSDHQSNTRSKLRKVLDAGGAEHLPWLGFEQEYTMFRNNTPLGWPEHGYPAPQGPYYCGVGSEQIFGRDLAIEHVNSCINANLIFYGMNAEVMPGQWEFQIGYRGFSEEDADALTVADHTWIARWLLHRISEKYGVHISLDSKPVKGDWNGAGMHTNFSTSNMRDPSVGKKTIDEAVKRLSKKHAEHIAVYGDKLEERLTGCHETASISEFSHGVANRGCSIRIPRAVALRQ
ncbi:MAG: glutamine synthetase [Candidatus Midichloriaceae bacterium]|jgi:glutamine synthetase